MSNNRSKRNSENRKELLTETDQLPQNLLRHYHRSRESFYSAEALPNFSCDKSQARSLKTCKIRSMPVSWILCESAHACGFTRLVATTDRSAEDLDN